MAQSLKHRWSVDHNFLSGITIGDWLRLLRENRFSVDPVYWHRAAYITLLSALKSFDIAREQRRYGAAVQAVEVPPPLFVLGHWRSGTTHLHNLLAEDTAQFAYPNNYEVFNPRVFLCTEDLYTRLFARLCPSRRPMDNMALSFRTPQEDEIAVALMSLRSPEFAHTFPRQRRHYDQYLTFRGVPEEEVNEWKATFLTFLKKLTLRYARPMILKSPAHTARIRLLLEMFPDARFVHIHRHPYALYQSLRHYYDTAAWYAYLQRPDRESVDERIFKRYNDLYDAYFEQRSLIPRGRFHEMSFEELEQDPVGQMELLYRKLGLPGFASVEPKLRDYLAGIAGYQKNRYRPLSEATRHRIENAWCRAFEEWGYETGEAMVDGEAQSALSRAAPAAA